MASRLSRKALAIGAFSLLAAQHVAAECNLNFTLLSRMTSTSLVGSIEYTVHGWGNDPDSDFSVDEARYSGSCWSVFNWGQACEWRKPADDTRLKDNNDVTKQWMVGHQGYEPLGGPYKDDLKIVDIGNGVCTDQTLECDGICGRYGGGPPGGGSPPTQYFWCYTRCANPGQAKPDALTPEELSKEILEDDPSAQLDGYSLTEETTSYTPLLCEKKTEECVPEHWQCTDGINTVAFDASANLAATVTTQIAETTTVVTPTCTPTNPPSGDTKDCRAEIGVVINRVENDKPLVTETLYFKDEEKNQWQSEMDVGAMQSLGGLGPLLNTTLLRNTASDFPFDLAMDYGTQSWNWLGCEFMSDSNLGQGTTMQSRKCPFICEG